MDFFISLMDLFLVYCDKFWRHKFYLALLIVLVVLFIAAIVFFGWKYRNTSFMKKVRQKGQLIFNVLVIAFGCLSVAFFVTALWEHKNLSLQDVSGIVQYEQQENLYDESGCENFFYDYDGSQVEAQNGSYMSNWIACSAGQKITRNGIPTNVVCYFDADKNFIERVDCYGMATITVPDNSDIAYFRMAVQPASDRKIVYGETIADDSLDGDYYMIPELKVDEQNFVKDFTIIQSPDGRQWKIVVDDEGNLSAKDVSEVHSSSDLPSDFPEYTITGSGIGDEEYLVVINTWEGCEFQYLFVMTPEGDVTWYKKVPVGAFNFRKLQYADGTIRYAYQQIDQVDGKNYIPNINGGILYTHIILMDENFNVINDNIHPIPYGSITDEDQKCESHDYKILGDNHYILSTITMTTVDNIPGMEGQEVQVVNAIIQEQKDGQVVMQWESIDHPELYSAAVYNNDYASFTVDSGNTQYTDYVHLNAIAIDPVTYDLLISCRSIGLMKLDRETGDILWIMGRGHNDIEGLSEEQIGLYQHDVRYTEDGSFTIFDNSGGVDKTSRICRYWIDEETLTLQNFEEFTTEYKSSSMGSAKLIDDETDTYLVSYGGGVAEFAFEEHNFSTDTVNFQFKFDNGALLYRIFSGIETVPTRDID